MPSKTEKEARSKRESTPTLGPEWNKFRLVIFDPWTVLSLIASGITLVWNAKDPSSVLVVLSGIFTAIAGAIIYDKWKEVSGRSKLILRGKSAVRAIESQIRLARSARISIEEYQSSFQLKTEKQRVLDCLREADSRLRDLQEQMISAIKEWSEIAPEAQIDSRVQDLLKINIQQNRLAQRILDLEQQVKDGTKDSEDQKKESAEQDQANQEEIDSLRKRLEKLKAKKDESGLSTFEKSLTSPFSIIRDTGIAADGTVLKIDTSTTGVMLGAGNGCPHCGSILPAGIALHADGTTSNQCSQCEEYF